MAPKESKEMLQRAAESAIRSIGLDYDVATDVRLKFCKQHGSPDPSLIVLNRDGTQDIVLPGSPTKVACDVAMGVVARDDQGQFLAAATWLLPNVSTVDSAKLMAIKHGLFLAARI